MWLILIGEFLNDLRKQKLRSFLTMLAICWGTLSVIILLSFGTGIGVKNMEGMMGGGDRIMMVYGGQTSLSYDGLAIGRRIRFVEEDVEMIRNNVPNIEHISAQYGRWGVSVRNGDKSRTTYCEGVDTGFEVMRTMYPVAGGRFLNEMDIAQQRRVVFLGNEIADYLFPDGEAVGNQIEIDGTPFTVIGVMQEKMQTSMNNGPDSNRLVIPFTTFQSMFGHRFLGSIVIRPIDPMFQEDVKNGLIQVLSRKYRFDPDDQQAVPIWDFIEMEKMNRAVNTGIQIFLFAVGFFTLLIAGVGVANIMYVVVKERTREIGIKKALGARRRHIIIQFIFESLFICLIGGLIGILISWGIVQGVLALELKDGAAGFLGNPILSNQLMLLTVGILSFIGLIAGVFPALKASKVDPVESLRYE